MRDQEVQKLLKIIKLLQLVASRLSKTLDSWNDFEKGDIVYFLNVEGSGDKPQLPHRCLCAINNHMLELHELHRSVSNQNVLLETFLNEVCQGAYAFHHEYRF